MSEPTNEQLQQRCLEFAGFIPLVKYVGLCYYFLTVKYPGYLYPDGNIIFRRTGKSRNEPPNFTKSVDAHVKWTIPKIKELGFYMVLWDFADIEERFEASFGKANTDERNTKGRSSESLALAICKAIWELTEKEND